MSINDQSLPDIKLTEPSLKEHVAKMEKKNRKQFEFGKKSGLQTYQDTKPVNMSRHNMV